jgi:uncharacterized iron-regulated membrane protein
MQKRRLFFRKVFQWHKWLGIIAGLFVLIFFISGAVIVFSRSLDTLEHPHLFKVQPTGKPLTYDALYRMAVLQRPDLYIYSFRYIPALPEETIEMRVYDPSDKTYPLLYINPYTGKVLGVKKHSVYDFFMTLHYTFYLGRIGELLAGIFALALLGSIITGTLVYRKHIVGVLLFRVPLRLHNWRVAASGLHRYLGVYTLLFNLVLAFSGFYMMLYAFDLKTQFGVKEDGMPKPPPLVHVNIDSAMMAMKKIMPGVAINYVDFPRVEGSELTISGDAPGGWLWGEYNNKVAFHYSTGAVLNTFEEAQLSFKEKFEYALYTLHFGQYGGMAVKVLYAVFSLAGVCIVVSGFLLYGRKWLK